MSHLIVSSRDANRAAALDLRGLAHQRSHRAGRSRHHHGFARLGSAEIQEAEIGRHACPKGIDCYFDNVGGDISDAVFTLMNPFGRVSVCGQISQYNLQKLLGQILVKQLKVEGFIVTRFQDRWPQGIAQMARWIQEGKIRYREDIVEGFENTPRAFIDMLQGKNTGKMLVKA